MLDEQGKPVEAGDRGRDLRAAAAAAGHAADAVGRRRAVRRRRTSSAFDGYYLSGDGGYVDEDGYLFVMGRTDDVINVAGHRLSTGSMEAVLAAHPAVAECAVIGVADPMKGQVPRGFVVLKAGVERDPDELASELVAMVRDEIGAGGGVPGRRASWTALPKTRSGKILRKTMREIADGKDAQRAVDDRGPRGARLAAAGAPRRVSCGRASYVAHRRCVGRARAEQAAGRRRAPPAATRG